jgi:predicted nucleic acid-binding protein
MYEVIRGLFFRKTASSIFVKVMELFENISLLSLDDSSMVKSAEISAELMRKGIEISDCDCLTAGIALSKGVHNIVTRNAYFKRINGVKVVEY